MRAKKIKEYKCKCCGNLFVKTISTTQQVCSLACAIKLGKQQTRQKREKMSKAKRLEIRKRMTALKEMNKSHCQLISEAQSAVNKYVRVRDKLKSCISCGMPLVGEKLGGGFDAGHYRSRGAAPHLRFYTLNIHGQCKRCNRWLGGNYHEYRAGLVERLGLEKVKLIESDNRSRHYSDDDLRRIKKIFNQKARKLGRRRGYDEY